ncbi:YciI family protein [Nocardioides speluncae]|uniref:YciI family protein n=1 Tax=Nocardioides speluncae TaxID=2670337 RepID=UPI000D69ED92|nr:YciI family protein [Nocardioides speluncae]
MKYVILIHSNPQPWGHPTPNFLPEYEALSPAEREQLDKEFEAFLGELHAAGELVSGEALGDPTTSKLYRASSHDDPPVATDGPYSESKEHLAGFFLIDVASQERAEEIAVRFSGPGETVELRPAMWSGGDEA